MNWASIAALLTGLAAVVVACGGVLLAIRAVRSKERRSAATELAQVESLLEAERNFRLDAELRAHAFAVALASNGIAVPALPVAEVAAIDPPRTGLREFRRPGHH